jgi:hypothetical protein
MFQDSKLKLLASMKNEKEVKHDNILVFLVLN